MQHVCTVLEDLVYFVEQCTVKLNSSSWIRVLLGGSTSRAGRDAEMVMMGGSIEHHATSFQLNVWRMKRFPVGYISSALMLRSLLYS